MTGELEVITDGPVVDYVDDYSISISDDGSTVVFAATPQQESVWDSSIGNHNVTYTLFNEEVSAGGQHVVTYDVGSGTFSSIGTTGSSSGVSPVISGDGKYIVFTGDAGSWTSDVTGDQLLRYNTETQEVDVVSSDANGVARGRGMYADVSADGRFIVFSSSGDPVAWSDWERDPDLPPDMTGGPTDARSYGSYLKDMVTGQVVYVGDSHDGSELTENIQDAQISADGSVITFNSRADNLVPGDGDAGGNSNVFAQYNPFLPFSANTIPSFDIASSVVAENADGSVVGELSATDADGEALTYTLTSRQDMFELAEDGVTLKLRDGVSLDYETLPSVDVWVEASDGLATRSEKITVTVSNVYEETDPPGVLGEIILGDHVRDTETEVMAIGGSGEEKVVSVSALTPNSGSEYFKVSVIDPATGAIEATLDIPQSDQYQAMGDISVASVGGGRLALTWNSSWSQTSNILLRLIDISDASGTTVISSDAGDITGETVIGNAGSSGIDPNSQVGVTSDGNIIVSYTKNTGNTYVQTFDVNGNIATAEQDIGTVSGGRTLLDTGQWIGLQHESQTFYPTPEHGFGLIRQTLLTYDNGGNATSQIVIKDFLERVVILCNS